MIRAATLHFCLSAGQLPRLLAVFGSLEEHADDYEEVLVTCFSRITDLENVDFAALLGHKGYDADGNRLVTPDELRALLANPTPFVKLTRRLGAANMLNTFRPDREFALQLQLADETTVTKLLVLLATEDGENLQYETYNGMPFDVGARWLQEPPETGIFCGEYVTPKRCASMNLRSALARRLLMPGAGRWACIPPSMRSAVESRSVVRTKSVFRKLAWARRKLAWAAAFHRRVGGPSSVVWLWPGEAGRRGAKGVQPKAAKLRARMQSVDGGLLGFCERVARAGEFLTATDWLLPSEEDLPAPGQYRFCADGLLVENEASPEAAAAVEAARQKAREQQMQWKLQQMASGVDAVGFAAQVALI
jgi:hypothetical protein